MDLVDVVFELLHITSDRKSKIRKNGCIVIVFISSILALLVIFLS